MSPAWITILRSQSVKTLVVPFVLRSVIPILDMDTESTTCSCENTGTR
jgi:hypothetical protein